MVFWNLFWQMFLHLHHLGSFKDLLAELCSNTWWTETCTLNFCFRQETAFILRNNMEKYNAHSPFCSVSFPTSSTQLMTELKLHCVCMCVHVNIFVHLNVTITFSFQSSLFSSVIVSYYKHYLSLNWLIFPYKTSISMENVLIKHVSKQIFFWMLTT